MLKVITSDITMDGTFKTNFTYLFKDLGTECDSQRAVTVTEYYNIIYYIIAVVRRDYKWNV